MQLIRSLSHTPDSLKQCVVALGNFDGLHGGHLTILHHTLEAAKVAGRPAAVMSFEPHPREFFKPEAPKLRLMRIKEKIMLLRELGFYALFLPRFNAQLAGTDAGEFVSELLVKTLDVHHVVTGNNFCFGKDRKGNSTLLAETAIEQGFGYSPIEAVEDEEGRIISSSAIRAALENGNPSLAGQLLGRPFTICGHVNHGDKRGRTIGFPTANLPLDNVFLPRAGVYAIQARIGATLYNGVANIGTRPTFDGTRPRLEAFLLDFDGDLYGHYIAVELIAFIRPEQKFLSLQQMTAQLQTDSARARELLSA